MGWSGSTYRKGNYATNGWTGDAANNIGIEAGRHDVQDDDFAQGITDCINKNGLNTPTTNLSMGGYKHTNVANATATTDYMAYGQILTGAPLYMDVANNRIGIGTSSPTTLLEVNKSTNGATVSGTINTNAGSSAYAAWKVSSNDGSLWGVCASTAGGGGASIYWDGATQLMLKTFGAYPLAFGTSNTERARFDSSGNFGIGTTAPVGKLNVVGSGQNGGVSDAGSKAACMRVSSSGGLTNDGGQIEFGAGYGTYTQSYFCAIKGLLQDGTSNTTGDLAILTRNATSDSSLTERIRFTANGRIGIGTNAPGYQLTLSSDSAAKPTSNTWTISSDARLKTNVKPYEKGLAEICQVNPITYDYNGKGGMVAGPGGVSIIAQDLQPIFPECVGTFYGKLNEEDEVETELFNYNGHAITFALINSIKELNAKVESLEASVAALEA